MSKKLKTTTAVKLLSPASSNFPALIVTNDLTVTLESTIDNWIKAVNYIHETTSEINRQHTELLYDQLAKMYMVYCYWAEHPNKAAFYERIDEFLDAHEIGYNSATTDAAKLAKTFIGHDRSKAKKYGNHMSVAYNRGVKAKDYRDWINDFGIEMISGQIKDNPTIAKPKTPAKKAAQITKARQLVLQWLLAKEAQPVASAEADIKDFQAGLSDANYYEISITKSRPHPTDKSKFIVDTLWTLPRTEEVEYLFINQLAHLVMNEVDKLEEAIADNELVNFKAQIEHELFEAELDKIHSERYERKFRSDVNDAADKRPDLVSSLYEKYDPKRKRKKTK